MSRPEGDASVPPPDRGHKLAALEPPSPGVRDLLEVHLLGLPLRILQRAREHHGELLRELSLLALKPKAQENLPSRLRELVILLTDHYGGQPYTGAAPRSVPLRAGVAAAPDCADLVVSLDRADALQANEFWSQLDEADQYCQREGILLTIGNGPTDQAFMGWYLGQFVDQANGLAPQEWAGAAR